MSKLGELRKSGWNRAPRQGLRAVAFTLVAAGAGAAAATGSFSSVATASVGTTVPTTIPSGSATPKIAVTGYWHQLAEDHFTAACAYMLPSERAACRSELRYGSVQIANPGIGHDFVDKTQALVTVLTTSACFGLGVSTTTTMCYSNTRPSAGLPKSDAGFAAAAQHADALESTLILTSEVGGSWYVDLTPPGKALAAA